MSVLFFARHYVHTASHLDNEKAADYMAALAHMSRDKHPSASERARALDAGITLGANIIVECMDYEKSREGKRDIEAENRKIQWLEQLLSEEAWTREGGKYTKKFVDPHDLMEARQALAVVLKGHGYYMEPPTPVNDNTTILVLPPEAAKLFKAEKTTERSR